MIQVDPAKGTLTECGIAVSLDVNSKPAPIKGKPMDDLMRTLTDHAAAFSTLPRDLNLEGIV
jgi:hypothetical protein